MARELLLPELAESVVEGEIIKWLVEEGDLVAEDQPVVEVMTDKVTVELPSPFAGVLQKRVAAEGDVVKVHQVIALFADAEASTSHAASAPSGTAVAGSAAGAATGAATRAAKHAPDGQSVQADEERSIVEGGAVVEDDGDGLSLFKPGDTLGDDQFITIRRPGASSAAPTGARSAAAPSSARAPAAAAAAASSAAAVATAPQPGARGPYGRVLAVPAARRLAREMNVDIEGVVGSGPNGRVRIDDVRKHAEHGSGSPAGTGNVQRQPYLSPAGYAELEERVPVRGLRRLIANQMVASHLQAVRTLHVDEADVSRLVELRQRLKPMAERRGVKLSYLPFILKAVVAALAENPALNASLDESTNEIVLKRYYNIGMAVATDAGLIVPVIKDVDRRSIVDLAAEVQRLAEGARTGKLAPDDVKGGTFSITNIGSLGGLFSFPIINVPEAGILGVHSIKKRPVVLADDSIVARSMIYLSLSFDHRLVDGAEGARFTGRVIELLETPEALFLDL
ncbi:MAG TPA: dihydrolipoamide acetyltransferase family protein [Trueperaceae bacterium]|nr:dihydrolipoamide acetyltransferase family protein [Trueperaceae bacterium]